MEKMGQLIANQTVWAEEILKKKITTAVFSQVFFFHRWMRKGQCWDRCFSLSSSGNLNITSCHRWKTHWQWVIVLATQTWRHLVVTAVIPTELESVFDQLTRLSCAGFKFSSCADLFVLWMETMSVLQIGWIRTNLQKQMSLHVDKV